MTKQTMFICHAQTPVLRPLSLMSLSISVKCIGKIPRKERQVYKLQGSKITTRYLLILAIVNQIII